MISTEYYPIVFFLLVILLMGLFMVGAGQLLGRRSNPYNAKNAPYECGFIAFENARTKFDVKYYLVTIIFILFDLEIAFLLPWALTIRILGRQGLITIMSFLIILTVGLIYAWKKGALEWK